MVSSIVWDVDPIILHIGSIELRWYGLMWGLGFLLAYDMVSRLFKKEHYPDTPGYSSDLPFHDVPVSGHNHSVHPESDSR